MEVWAALYKFPSTSNILCSHQMVECSTKSFSHTDCRIFYAFFLDMKPSDGENNAMTHVVGGPTWGNTHSFHSTQHIHICSDFHSANPPLPSFNSLVVIACVTKLLQFHGTHFRMWNLNLVFLFLFAVPLSSLPPSTCFCHFTIHSAPSLMALPFSSLLWLLLQN